jgi:FMN reductase
MNRRPVPVTVLVGHPRGGSRTRLIGLRATTALCAGLARAGLPLERHDLVELADFGPHLPSRLLRHAATDPAIEQALRLTRRPGLLVVVSPTFKGSYPGLLKLFLDMLPVDGLGQGTVAVPVMTASWPQHRFVVDLHLRGLLLELGAHVPSRGLCVTEAEFDQADSVISTWVRAAVPALLGPLWDGRPEAAPPGLDSTAGLVGAITS